MLEKLRFACWVMTFILGAGSIVMLFLAWLTTRNSVQLLQEASTAIGVAFLSGLIYLIGLSLEKLLAERSTLQSIGKSIGNRIAEAGDDAPGTDQ